MGWRALVPKTLAIAGLCLCVWRFQLDTQERALVAETGHGVLRECGLLAWRCYVRRTGECDQGPARAKAAEFARALQTVTRVSEIL